jgi:hypothetical protein
LHKRRLKTWNLRNVHLTAVNSVKKNISLRTQHITGPSWAQYGSHDGPHYHGPSTATWAHMGPSWVLKQNNSHSIHKPSTPRMGPSWAIGAQAWAHNGPMGGPRQSRSFFRKSASPGSSFASPGSSHSVNLQTSPLAPCVLVRRGGRCFLPRLIYTPWVVSDEQPLARHSHGFGGHV